MAKCLIFCAAEFDSLIAPVAGDDLIIAADGGLEHLKKIDLEPDEILGDFDSLGYTPRDARVFPVEKDDTDAMLAARRGLELGYRDFIFYGSLDGPRLDHTVANFQTLQFLADRGARGYLVGTNQVVTVLQKGSLDFGPESEGILSVFCLGAEARGVTLEGLHYPLDRGALTPGFPLGVSNHFTGRPARITVTEGSLLVMWDRKNGLPAV